jgi:predicted TIM-barrel fold metal-dependent hydrolase
MNIVDSHSHASQWWYEPVELLAFQLDRNGVERAVLVQVWAELDNGYQAACLRRYPGRFASVVRVDTDRSDAPEVLAQCVDDGATGVRLRPITRSPGDDPLAIWRAAERLSLAVSCVGSPVDFASDAFADLLSQLPNLPIVIEHIGEVQPAADGHAELADRIFSLARYDNVYMKIHGLGEFAQRAARPTATFAFERPVPDLLQRTYRSFGPERMMWGSDYPGVSKREGYTNSLRWAMDELADLTPGEKSLVFGGVASSIFKFG